MGHPALLLGLERAVGFADAQVNDDEAVVSLGHPDCATARDMELVRCGLCCAFLFCNKE